MIRRPITTATALLALFPLGLAGCAGEPGDATVVVGLTTDLAVGFDVHRIHVTTTVDGVADETERLSYASGELSLPAELPVTGPDGAPVEITVEAFGDKQPEPFLTRTAATRAVAGRTPLLPLSLDEACAGVTCSPGDTCVEGACQSVFLEPQALGEHDPEWLSSAPDACKTPSSGEPEIVLGRGQTTFESMRPGEVVPIEQGAQGGHHVWLALRVTGLRQMGSVLVARGTFPELAVELPPVTSIVTLRRSEGEGCELRGLRFQVDHGLPVDAVRGQTLDIQITLEDSTGDVATASHRVVIEP